MSHIQQLITTGAAVPFQPVFLGQNSQLNLSAAKHCRSRIVTILIHRPSVFYSGVRVISSQCYLILKRYYLEATMYSF